MATINSRIKEIIEHLAITPYEFSKKMGDKRPDTLYNLLKDHGTEPSPKTLTKIKENFPQIDYTWLLTGEGEMIKNETELERIIRSLKITDEFIDALYGNKRFIEKLDTYFLSKSGMDASDEEVMALGNIILKNLSKKAKQK